MQKDNRGWHTSTLSAVTADSFMRDECSWSSCCQVAAATLMLLLQLHMFVTATTTIPHSLKQLHTSRLQMASCWQIMNVTGHTMQNGYKCAPFCIVAWWRSSLASHYDSYSSDDELSTTACADSFVSLLASATSPLKMLLGFCTAQTSCTGCRSRLQVWSWRMVTELYYGEQRFDMNEPLWRLQGAALQNVIADRPYQSWQHTKADMM